MTSAEVFGLFERFGVELEYMIVDQQSLGVRPIADRLLAAAGGPGACDVERGAIDWSNELARHLIELKTSRPATQLAPLADLFQQQIGEINRLLQPWNCQLMPTAMHPWMDPHGELQLWPLEYSTVYETYNRIFDCRGHGWANLQSVHLNLPFKDDDQFGRLHTAIRLVLPLLPALAASSPIVEGRLTGLADNRLEYYRQNSRAVPLVAGQIVPEVVLSQQEYDDRILQPMYRQIAPLDTDRVLQEEWLNSRGAIARFERQTIEIRLLDLQEAPLADLALCGLIVSLLRELVGERWTSYDEQQLVDTEALADLLRRCIRSAESTVIDNASLIRQFGAQQLGTACTAEQLWRHIVSTLTDLDGAGELFWLPPIERILDRGTLSRRIQAALPNSQMTHVYRSLCQCLREGKQFG